MKKSEKFYKSQEGRSVEEGAEDWERTEVAHSAEVGRIVLDEEVEDGVAVVA